MNDRHTMTYMGIPIRVIPDDVAPPGSVYVVAEAYDDEGNLVMSAAKLYGLAEDEGPIARIEGGEIVEYHGVPVETVSRDLFAALALEDEPE